MSEIYCIETNFPLWHRPLDKVASNGDAVDVDVFHFYNG